MRVAYVVGTVAGGAGEHVAMLARGCAQRGAEVTVYGPAQAGRRFFRADPPAPPGPAVGFVPVEIADRPRPARDVAAVLRLRGLLADARPDVVHAHGLRAGAAAALALMGLTRGALAVTVHNAPPASGTAAAVYAVLERIVARRADAVICVSADLAARMRRLGAAVAGPAIVPAPVSWPAGTPDGQAVAAARAGIARPGEPVVLAVGRLAPQKGFATLLAAAARWQGREPCPVIALAGTGPLDQVLRAAADAGGIRMRFLGQRGDVPVLLAGADVVAVPSLWEGQPLIVQEALRAGRPLVASRVGGIPDLTGQDAAVLVPPGDAAALADAVLSVLDDPALSCKLGAAARARADALPTPDDAVDAALGLYRRLSPPAGGNHPHP
ncbi:MAG TPA: glycosyltransferase family 4 protein [Streptosporangiaceae bacterium]|nr:glycosyltransferase family 4 protein [Streptosporangiaceae bacterium]